MVDANGNGNGNGRVGEVVSANFTRWVISIMIAALMGMAGIVWANLTSQITEVRADNRIVQKDTADLRLAIQDLKLRLTTLVETLNSREDQRVKDEQRRR